MKWSFPGAVVVNEILVRLRKVRAETWLTVCSAVLAVMALLYIAYLAYIALVVVPEW